MSGNGPGPVVAIDFLPESALAYTDGWAVVAIDLMRATTTAVTIAHSGRRCLPVASPEAAHELAEQGQQVGRANRRVTRETQLDPGCENSERADIGGVTRRQNEHGLGQVEF